jgi:hypothetical protein
VIGPTGAVRVTVATRLLIHGARSCVHHLDRTRDPLGTWLDQLQARMHVNKVVVALAAKMARIAWVILTKPVLFTTAAKLQQRRHTRHLDCEVRGR